MNYIWEKFMVEAFVSPSNAFDLARLRTPALVAACVAIGIAFFFLWPAEQTPFIYFQF